MKKTLSLVLVLAMLFSAMLGVMSTAEAEAPAGDLVISAANLEFASDVYLLIAVDYSALGLDAETAKESVTISIDDEILEVNESVMSTSNFPANCVGFKYTNLGAMRFGDKLSIQAYINGEASGDAIEYSVLEYTLRARELYPSYTILTEICDNLLAFGAAAQKAFGHEGDFDLDKKYGMVFLQGAEGKEILPAGTKVTFSAPAGMVDPLLYDTHLNRVSGNEVTVPESTIARYLYIPAASKTIINFDATNESLTSDMINVANNTTGTARKDVYNDANGNFSSSKSSGTGENILQLLKYSTGGVSSVTLVEENGKNQHLKLVCGHKSASIQFRARPASESVADAYNMVGDVFTITLTLGKDGDKIMCPAFYRLRGSGNTTRVSLIGFDTKDNVSELRAPSNTSATVLAKLITDGTNTAFATVHIVIDLNAHTATYYTATNTTTPAFVYTNELINKDNVFTSAYAFEFVIERAGTTLLQKMVYTKGNIFA